MGSHDEGSLLALYQADMGIGMLGEQVLTEETLVELPVGWQQSGAYEWHVSPSLIAVTMAVEAVLHDVAAMYLSEVIYLPKDDIPLAGGSNQIVIEDALKLFRGKV